MLSKSLATIALISFLLAACSAPAPTPTPTPVPPTATSAPTETAMPTPLPPTATATAIPSATIARATATPISTPTRLSSSLSTAIDLFAKMTGTPEIVSVVSMSGESLANYLKLLEDVKKGDFDQAIVDGTRGIELNPKFPEPYYLRGLAYRNKALKPQAIADFQNYLALVPNAPDRAQIEQWIRELQAQ